MTLVSRPTKSAARAALAMNAPPQFCVWCIKRVEKAPCQSKKEKTECQKK